MNDFFNGFIHCKHYYLVHKSRTGNKLIQSGNIIILKQEAHVPHRSPEKTFKINKHKYM